MLKYCLEIVAGFIVGIFQGISLVGLAMLLITVLAFALKFVLVFQNK